ncbi:MAG: hypothetical protein HY675_04650 [Chloroflexi bacterium]|nr:hypothetical protein [Chloroflexota bacterium]
MRRVLWLLTVLSLLIGLVAPTLAGLPQSASAASLDDLCSLLPPGYSLQTNGAPPKGTAVLCEAGIQDPKISWTAYALSVFIERQTDEMEARVRVSEQRRWSAQFTVNEVPGLGNYALQVDARSGPRPNPEGSITFYFARGRYFVSVGARAEFADKTMPIAQAIDRNLQSLLGGPPAPAPTPAPPRVSPTPEPTDSEPPIDCSTSTGDLRVSPTEMNDIIRFRWRPGLDPAEVNQTVIADILALVRARGGSGTVRCGYDPTVSPQPTPTPPPKEEPPARDWNNTETARILLGEAAANNGLDPEHIAAMWACVQQNLGSDPESSPLSAQAIVDLIRDCYFKLPNTERARAILNLFAADNGLDPDQKAALWPCVLQNLGSDPEREPFTQHTLNEVVSGCYAKLPNTERARAILNLFAADNGLDPDQKAALWPCVLQNLGSDPEREPFTQHTLNEVVSACYARQPDTVP